MERKTTTLASLNTRHFTAYLDEVALRTGKISRRLKIDHPEAVAVVPFIDKEHIIMVRQWRYAIEEETLEIPAGKMDKGESIEEAVQRELAEETSYKAGTLKKIISYFPAVAYSNEIIHIFYASDLSLCSSTIEEEEITKVEKISFKEALNMVFTGKIKDGKTIIGILTTNTFLKELQSE